MNPTPNQLPSARLMDSVVSAQKGAVAAGGPPHGYIPYTVFLQFELIGKLLDELEKRVEYLEGRVGTPESSDTQANLDRY